MIHRRSPRLDATDPATYQAYASAFVLVTGLVFLVAVGILANLLVFSDSKTFHTNVKGLDVIYYSEGLSGTVTALEKGRYRGLFVDGQNVSGTDPVLLADSKMLAHLPLMLADEPEAALTVGYGTGTTSGSMLLHDVEVHAVEIEDKIIERAQRENRPWQDITSKCEVIWFDAMKGINVERPTSTPHATEYVDEMVELIEQYARICRAMIDEDRDGIRRAAVEIGYLGPEEQENRARAAVEVFREKLIKRNISLKAFEAGADAVAVLACPEETCRYVQGNLRAKRRVARDLAWPSRHRSLKPNLRLQIPATI